MEIRVYRPPETGDPRFVPVCATNSAQSIRYVERFHTYGSFEITMPTAAYGADKFEKYMLVYIDRSFWGIVLGVHYSLSTGGDMKTIVGLCIKGLTYARCTMPPSYTYEQVGGTAGYDVVNGSTETCMKHYIESNFFSASSPTRNIPGLEIAPDLGRGNPNDYYMTRFAELSGVLEDLGKSAGIGYVITPDLAEGKLVFDVAEGCDRSMEQSSNPRVLFEVRRRNVESMEYRNDDMNMRNLFYATLSGARYEDEAYTATVTRDGGDLPSGIRRWERHMDISATHPTPGQELTELTRLARMQAGSYETAELFTASILNMPKKYREDYFLGDIVTVQNHEWGVSMHARLTEMSIEASDGGVKHTATFGEAPLNFIGRLRRQIKGG